MIKGTKAEVVIKILHKIPLKHRKKVREVTDQHKKLWSKLKSMNFAF